MTVHRCPDCRCADCRCADAPTQPSTLSYEPYPDTAEWCARGVVIVYPQPKKDGKR